MDSLMTLELPADGFKPHIYLLPRSSAQTPPDPAKDWHLDGSSPDIVTYDRNQLSAIGSQASSEDEILNDFRVDEDDLLELCDDVRGSLIHRQQLGPRWEEAIDLLSAVLKSETRGAPVLEFTTIQASRLDKLLSDMTNVDNRPSPIPPRFENDISVAERLQRRWRSRFRGAYFTIEQERYFRLPKSGRLKDIMFCEGDSKSSCLWTAKTLQPLSEVEGNAAFEAGHWWLNLACAHRDGIIGGVFEAPTHGEYGIAALPLISGYEDADISDHTVRYIKDGSCSDMHVSLMSRVGSQIRILRGHRLRSPIAPKAGIRYDGLYIIRQYGQRRNPKTEVYRLILTLERVKDQPSIESIASIPRPSQLDDWHLFEKYEGEAVKQKRGDQGFLDWKSEKAEDTMDRQQYTRALEFYSSLELAKFGHTGCGTQYLKVR